MLKGLGKVDTLLADNGWFSEANVKACEATGIEPMIAMGRQPHHPTFDECFAEATPLVEQKTPVRQAARTDARSPAVCNARTGDGAPWRRHAPPHGRHATRGPFTLILKAP